MKADRLHTCPQGHQTLWPDACPVCLAKRTPFHPTERFEAMRRARYERDQLLAAKRLMRKAGFR